MSASDLQRFDVLDDAHGRVPCAALLPEGADAELPLCLFLYGGGGTRESLAEIQPLLESWWASGTVPRMLVATPDVGAWSFYLDDPQRGLYWERFVAERFVTHLAARFNLGRHTMQPGIVGMSMGGYGALKIALSRCGQFAAVAAISPMLEPAFEAGRVPLRNRYHYPPEVPQALLGPERDAVLYESDHPATRARRSAAALRQSALAIYLDAAGSDALNAHDGAEDLHRVLWQLDVRHEYRLRRDADHIGPEILERLRDAFVWVGAHQQRAIKPLLTDAERAWQVWLDGDRSGPTPPVLAPTSTLFPRVLRARLAPLWERAAAIDATLSRHYGQLSLVSDGIHCRCESHKTL